MFYKLIFFIQFLPSLTLLASACEGECIVQITKAFLGNYSVPIHTVFKELSQQVSTALLPPSRRLADPMKLVQPILDDYSDVSYDILENAIFPSYFHGKCQRFSKDGQDPPGCPNPDCPVVCGTPGSLVHFYSMLRYIAFNSTSTTLEKFTTPGDPTYEKVATLVRRAQAMHKRDSAGTRSMGILLDPRKDLLHEKRALSPFSGTVDRRRDMLGLRASPAPTLASILAQFTSMFSRACGGNARNSEDALPECSWEDDMKKFILSFP